MIKKMRQEPMPRWVPVFQDLESYHTAEQFAMSVYKEIHQFLSQKGRATRRVAHLRKELKPEHRKQLLRDLRYAPAWMHPHLRYIAGEEEAAR